MSLPVDRGHVSTEQRHAASEELHRLDAAGCVRLLVEDHRAVTTAIDGAAEALVAFIEDLIPRFEAGGRLVYLGAGTSGRLGVLDAAECPPTFNADPDRIVGIIAGGDTSLRRSSEAREDDPGGAIEALAALCLAPADTVLGIAAGGTTPYVRGGLEHAHRGGALTGLLTCAPEVTAPPGCDHLIVLDTGPELLAGSTRLKAGSATKLALNTITTTLFVQTGKVYSNLMVDLRATNEKLRDRALRILQTLCPDLDRVAAADTIDRAGGDLKTAVVISACCVDPETAARWLAEHHGRLDAVLDRHRAR